MARVHLRPTTGLLRNVSPRRVAGNSTWDGKDKKKNESREGGGGGGERDRVNQHKGGGRMPDRGAVGGGGTVVVLWRAREGPWDANFNS